MDRHPRTGCCAAWPILLPSKSGCELQFGSIGCRRCRGSRYTGAADVALAWRCGDAFHADHLGTQLADRNKPTKVFQGNGILSAVTYPDGQSTYRRYVTSSLSDITNQAPATVQQLGNILASSTDTNIQLGAATALRNMHTAQAVVLLAPYLSSANTNLRDEAIAALSCFANGSPAIYRRTHPGAAATFAANSPYQTTDMLTHFAIGARTIDPRVSYYLTFWAKWWNDNSSSVAGNSGAAASVARSK